MADRGSERRKRCQEYALGEALMASGRIGLPAIHPPPPSPLGGGPPTGGGGYRLIDARIFSNRRAGLDASPTGEVLIEESLIRLEGFRDGGRPRQGG